MIATIGIGIALNNTVQGLFGAQNMRFPAGTIPTDTIEYRRHRHHGSSSWPSSCCRSC